jgi:50S ribosomal subunit-associated GTPase HflX
LKRQLEGKAEKEKERAASKESLIGYTSLGKRELQWMQ